MPDRRCVAVCVVLIERRVRQQSIVVAGDVEARASFPIGFLGREKDGGFGGAPPRAVNGNAPQAGERRRVNLCEQCGNFCCGNAHRSLYSDLP